MEAANIRYVARSYSLLKNEYSPNFVYTEGIGHRFFLTALLADLMIIGFLLFLLMPGAKNIIDYLCPSRAMSKEEIDSGSFCFKGVGVSEPDEQNKA